MFTDPDRPAEMTLLDHSLHAAIVLANVAAYATQAAPSVDGVMVGLAVVSLGVAAYALCRRR